MFAIMRLRVAISAVRTASRGAVARLPFAALRGRRGGGDPPRSRMTFISFVSLVLFAAVARAEPVAAASTVTIAPYGTMADGRVVEQATLVNGRGIVVKVIGY